MLEPDCQVEKTPTGRIFSNLRRLDSSSNEMLTLETNQDILQYMMQFAEWIDKELHDRGWSRRTAAKQAGVSASMFDKVINGHAAPGITFFQGIAKAFDMPLSKILFIAGYIEIDPNNDTLAPDEAELIQLFRKLPPEDQGEIVEIIRLKINRKRK